MTETRPEDRMSAHEPRVPLASDGLAQLRTRWAWFLSLGIVLEVLGIVALGSAFLVSIRFLGWLFILCGVVRGVHALRVRRGSGYYFIDLVTALLYVMVGVLIIVNREPGITVRLTFAIAALLMMDGILHVVGSVMARYPNWRSLLVHGIVVLLFGLGLAIWQQLRWQVPVARVWVIACFLGITTLVNGWSLIVLDRGGSTLPESRQ